MLLLVYTGREGTMLLLSDVHLHTTRQSEIMLADLVTPGIVFFFRTVTAASLVYLLCNSNSHENDFTCACPEYHHNPIT